MRDIYLRLCLLTHLTVDLPKGISQMKQESDKEMERKEEIKQRKINFAIITFHEAL